MAIGERIRFIRNLRGMTQKYLGTLVGFSARTADIRIAQYESGARTPKDDLTKNLAIALDVSPMALTVPNIDSEIGLMHTLFAMEDLYGLEVGKLDSEICLRFNSNRGIKYLSLFERFSDWLKESEKYRNGEISKEEYNRWRYTYPEVEIQRTRNALDELCNAKNSERE